MGLWKWLRKREGGGSHQTVFVVFCFTTIGVTIAEDLNLQFLKGVRCFNSNTIDYYYSCNVVGELLRWQVGTDRLSSFRNDAGRVIVPIDSTYKCMAVLLSSQPAPARNHYYMDSVIVVTHDGEFSNPTDLVTCSNGANNSSIPIVGNVSAVESTNSSDYNEVQLDYILSSQIVRNRNFTHFFMCRVSGGRQFFEVEDFPIGFDATTDKVFQARSVFIPNSDEITVLGILVPYYNLTAIYFVSKNYNINITCSDDNYHQAQLPSNGNPATTRMPSTTHTTPANPDNVTSSLPTEDVTSLSHITTDKMFNNPNTNWIIATAIVLSLVLIISVLAAACICWCCCRSCCFQSQRRYPPNLTTMRYFASGKADTEHSASEIGPSESICGETDVLFKDLESPPSKNVLMEKPEGSTSENGAKSCSDGTPDKDASVALVMGIESPSKREDPPMATDLEKIAIRGGKSERESASSSGHTSETIQHSVEESSSEEASFRICESSTKPIEHEPGVIGCLKTFESLQEAVFIGANELGQSYWNTSVSGSQDVVQCEKSPDEAINAAGNTRKMLVQNMKNNEEDINTTFDQHDDVRIMEESNDAHDDDDPITEKDKDALDNEDRDALDDVHVMEEDKDTPDDTAVTEKDKDTPDDAAVTEKDKDTPDDAAVTEKDKDTPDDAAVTEKDKDTPDDAAVTKKDKDTPDDAAVTEKDKDTPDNAAVTEKDKDTPDDAAVIEKDKDTPDDAAVTEEDKDTLTEVSATEEVKDTLVNVPVAGEGKDTLDDAFITEEDKDTSGNNCITKEHKYAKTDKRVTAEESGAECGFSKLRKGVLWFYALMSEISGVSLDGGGTLHIPVIVTYSRWG